MSISISEKQLFQTAVRLAAIVPIAAGGAGALFGPGMIRAGVPPAADLESHFRYLSGLLFGIGLAFLWAVARIDQRAAVFRVLGLIVIAGGLARLSGIIGHGLPGAAHRLALIMELLVVPGLLLWLGRLERNSEA